MPANPVDMEQPSPTTRAPIAIVGIGCRMPGGVDSPQAFWDVLVNQQDMVSEVPADRWSLESFHDPDQSNYSKMVTRRGGFIHNMDKFDNAFFKISPREASSMDPQQRHILEVTYEAFQDAGIIPTNLGESCGVYIGVGMMDYAVMLTETSLIGPYMHTGTAHSSVANRLSYVFDLRGPSFAVETACASSMTAMHLACNAIWDGECTYAVSGGCNALLIPETTVGFSALGVLSAEGKCCPFSNKANGYVRSEGFGAFILKPLETALTENDHIYAVIRGSSIAANGFCKSLTMPSGPAQEMVMRSAYKRFGVPTSSVQYVEAHGTGTPVGDPIEAEAIGSIFGSRNSNPIKIGSVKSNFGHNECAAGITSSIKVALMLDKKTLVPTINHDKPNPSIDLKGLKLHVQTTIESMKCDQDLYTIGLNSFGFSGAVAHMIFQEAPKPNKKTAGRSTANWKFGDEENTGKPIILPLSAKSKDALGDLANKWMEFDCDSDALSVVSWQATRRDHHPYRLTVITNSGASCRRSLAGFLQGAVSETVVSGTVAPGKPKICFVFPGQGQQWVDMGRKLYEADKVFRDAIDKCDFIYKKISGWSLLDRCGLFNGHAVNPETSPYSSVDDALNQVEVVQPAITFIQVALLHLWGYLGVHPDLVVGHSVGEIAAAYACGGLTLVEAISVIYYRSHEQAKQKGTGRMAALRATKEQAEKICEEHEHLYIAAVNAPGSMTLAGNTDVIAAVVENNPGKAKQLRVTCAFHTPEMDPIKEPFMAAMKGVVTSESGKRDVPYYSTVTGEYYNGSFGTEYWWSNIRSAVLFQPAIESILQDTKADIFLEIAASNTLLTPIKQIAHALDPKNPPVIINSSLRDKDDLLNMQRAMGYLYTNGVSLDWGEITENTAEWAPVPTYPWQHQSFWLETDERQKRRLGLDDRTIRGQNGKFTLEMFPFMADHVVGNRIVFPGAGYVEYMIQMAFSETEKPALKNINFTRVLPWPEDTDPKKCTLKLGLVKDGTVMQVTCEGNQHSDAQMESVSSKTGDTCFSLKEIQDRCTTEVSSELFYSRLDAVGLKYGPAFQTVEKMFLGDGEALAILTPVADNKQRIQVTHFDATFQLVLSAVGPFSAMYLPIRIDSIQMATEALPSGKNILAYTKIHDYDSTYIGADITMLALDGQVLADIKGFLAQNFSGNQSDVPIESCVYTTRWQPTSASTLPTSVLSDVFQETNLREICGDELDGIQRAEIALNDLEGVCVSYIRNALAKVPSKEQTNANIAKYITRIKSIPANTKTKPIPYNHIPEVLKIILNKAPELKAEVNLLMNFGDTLPETLMDPQVGLSVLYPEEGIDRYFHDSLSTRLYYKATSQAMVKAICEAAKNKTIVRVLEVGGKTGSFTQLVLEPLKEMGLTGQMEYVFADGSKRLVQQAQDNLGEYSFIEYKQLDIKRNAKEQDFVANSFDIVICVNALNATDDIQQSANYIYKLVSPYGLMFIIENTHMHFMADFFSLDTVEEHCLLSRQGWVDTMVKIGLEDVVSVSSPQEFFQSVIAGRKPVMSPQNIITDNKLLIIQNDSNQLTSSFLQSYKGKSDTYKFSTAKSFYHIINEQANSPAEVMYVYSEEDSRLQALLRLFQAVESCPEAVTRMWVLTTGANGSSLYPSGSLAVGLTRAVSNQIPSVPMFTVDFDPCSSAEDNVQELLKLMNDEPGEQEIIIRRGERCVPRLIHQDLQHISKVQSNSWRVEQDLKGPRSKGASIDDLAFHDVPDLEIPPGHVKISVNAAPLNFKDVMMALGLLEGLESDVHPSFGLECAGEVVEVGSGVSSLKVGDKVMAFGKSCFASHTVCDSRLTVPKPDNLSWLDSSSVGVIFVTAYLSLVERANLKRDETVLIHSACGGVGLAAIQIARMRGARIICTAGTEEKRSYLRQELGLDMVSDSRSSRFYDDVMQWTGGKGVDVVLNSLSGKLLQTGLSLLSPGGRFCEIGKRDILQGSSLPMGFFLENKVFHSCQLDILMRQRPEDVQSVMQKVVSLLEDKTLNPIPTSVYSIENLKDTFRVMSKGSHIGKIVFEVPDNFQPKDVQPSLCQFKPSATYIITGGYGGIGQALARWLCLNGAKHIALVSRRGATTAAAKRTLNFLKKNNVNMYEFSLDISNKASVATLLQKLREDKRAPPIKGIFHLAGVIDEESLSEITQEQMDRILGAKALGAQHLNELTQQDDLDVFFMLSSISTTWGHQAQPCYCAANAYLDALAEKRHSSGLPALSVQLAPVKGAGYLEDKGQTVKVLAMKGCYQLHVDEFLQVVGQLLPRRDLPVVTFANQDWGITQTTCHKSMLKFHHLATRSKATSTKGEAQHMELADMETNIKSKMAELLCMSEDAIDISQPMVNYGVDSLVALEIANWATNQLGVEISQLDILGGMTTVELIEKAMEAN